MRVYVCNAWMRSSVLNRWRDALGKCQNSLTTLTYAHITCACISCAWWNFHLLQKNPRGKTMLSIYMTRCDSQTNYLCLTSLLKFSSTLSFNRFVWSILIRQHYHRRSVVKPSMEIPYANPCIVIIVGALWSPLVLRAQIVLGCPTVQHNIWYVVSLCIYVSTWAWRAGY